MSEHGILRPEVSGTKWSERRGTAIFYKTFTSKSHNLLYNNSTKSPKEISVDQKLIALTAEIIESTEEKDQLPLLLVRELIELE